MLQVVCAFSFCRSDRYSAHYRTFGQNHQLKLVLITPIICYSNTLSFVLSVEM